MGLLDDDAPETLKPYQFASAPIDEFINEMNVGKQQQNIDDTDLDELDNQSETTENEPLEKLKMRPSVANATGKLLAGTVDTVIPILMSLVIKDDLENYKASKDEFEDLADAFGQYAALKGADIPPGVALLITVGTIYGAKGYQGIQNKKLNDRNAELEKQLAEMREKYEKTETVEQTT